MAHARKKSGIFVDKELSCCSNDGTSSYARQQCIKSGTPQSEPHQIGSEL